MADGTPDPLEEEIGTLLGLHAEGRFPGERLATVLARFVRAAAEEEREACAELCQWYEPEANAAAIRARSGEVPRGDLH